MNQHVMLRMLARLGYTADAVCNGAEAVALDNQTTPMLSWAARCEGMPTVDAYSMRRKIQKLLEGFDGADSGRRRQIINDINVLILGLVRLPPPVRFEKRRRRRATVGCRTHENTNGTFPKK